jgi:polar amino acid transport system permease protein
MAAELLVGAKTTFGLFLLSWLFGFPLGLLIALSGFRRPAVKRASTVLGILVASMPILALILWIHYPLQYMLEVVWPPVFTVWISLVIYVTLSVADQINQGITIVDKKYGEVATALNLGSREYFLRVVLPNTLYVTSPRLLTLAVATIHLTMFGSLIGVEDVFRIIQRLNTEYLNPIRLYTIMAFLYLIICLPLYVAARLLTSRVAESGFENA